MPRSTLLWLLIGILSLISLSVLERAITAPDKTPRKIEKGPSEIEFRAATNGETETRTALAEIAFRDIGLNISPEVAGKDSARSKSEPSPLESAIKTYREALETWPSPNVPRRLLILEHLAGKKLDEALLTRWLPKDLRDLKTSESEIASEIVLWQSLYATNGPQPPPDALQRIDKMHLRLLGTQAQIDLYERLHNTAAADEQKRIRNQDAIRFFLIAGAGTLLGGFAFLLGAGLLLFIFFTLCVQKSPFPGKIISEAHLSQVRGRANFTDLIDVFAFYFAAFEFSRVFFSLVLLPPSRSGNTPAGSNTTLILLELVLYLLPHGAAFLYLANRLKRFEIDWSEVGLSVQHLWANIGYGILGYCAALPLMLLLGFISERIFRNNPDVAPNPAMSLIVTQENIIGQIVLFVMIAVAAPLCEELFFRGVLLGGMRKRYGVVISILFSSVLFALGHPIQDWLPILGLGIAFGTMREMRQSLIPSITAHFLQNSLTYIYLSLLFGSH